MYSNREANTTQRLIFGKNYCSCVCRYEKASGKTLAWFKRHSNRVTRRRLRADLRRDDVTTIAIPLQL